MDNDTGQPEIVIEYRNSCYECEMPIEKDTTNGLCLYCNEARKEEFANGGYGLNNE